MTKDEICGLLRQIHDVLAMQSETNQVKSASDYERGVIDGMQKQAESSVDRAASQPEQEPIGEAHLMQSGFTHCIWSEACVPVGTKFYTHPPQRTEPVCPECKAGVLYECVACSSNNYPPQRTWVNLTDREFEEVTHGMEDLEDCTDMNERTKQLWEESQQWNGSDDGRGGLKILESVEKFAELIVRECTELTLDYKSDDYYNGWLDYRDEIKRHFGVEE